MNHHTSLASEDSKIIKKRLKQFYDKEAQKYYETRQKYRKDVDYLLDEVKSLHKSKIKILEFWCWGGRFIKYLREHYEGEIEYIGVDLSSELLKFAQKDNPHDTFICNDICKEVLNYEQETFDLIVGTSSFQHIPTQQERSFLIKHFYRILKYEGKFLMLNRTYSDRFVKKYKKQVFLAKLKRFFTLWNCSWRDIEVPWTNRQWETSYRYYHLFDLKEYKNLIDYSWFSLKKCCYLDNQGEISFNEHSSKSSLFIAEKYPFQR